MLRALRPFLLKSERFSSLRPLSTRADPTKPSKSPLIELEVCSQTYPADDWTNVTPLIVSLTGQKLYRKPPNPLHLISEGIKEYFEDLQLFEFPSPVVDLEANFDSLLVAKDHVSRRKSDTYYVNANHVLRSHTSAHQGHCLRTGSTAFLCIADVYRRDAVDSTHFPAFHQCEALRLYTQQQVMGEKSRVPIMEMSGQRTDVKQEHYSEEATREVELRLKSTIEGCVRHLLGKYVNMRWVPAYFPFTCPSFELEILFKNQWMEILGAGVVEHRLLTNNGVTDQIGWALGFGLERLAMLKYAIPDIRLFWSKDSGFLSQFEGAKPEDMVTYRPISDFPQCPNDISFWLPSNCDWSPNDFYDLVRSLGGDLIEQVQLIDEFTNKKGRTSNCFRITYRSNERTLTQQEVNQVHKLIETEASKRLNVEIR